MADKDLADLSDGGAEGPHPLHPRLRWRPQSEGRVAQQGLGGDGAALDGGEDGCDSYRAIFSNIKYLLSKEGVIVLEVGYDILKTVKQIVKNSGFKVLKIYKDLLGVDRVLLIK